MPRRGRQGPTRRAGRPPAKAGRERSRPPAPDPAPPAATARAPAPAGQAEPDLPDWGGSSSPDEQAQGEEAAPSAAPVGGQAPAPQAPESSPDFESSVEAEEEERLQDPPVLETPDGTPAARFPVVLSGGLRPPRGGVRRALEDIEAAARAQGRGMLGASTCLPADDAGRAVLKYAGSNIILTALIQRTERWVCWRQLALATGLCPQSWLSRTSMADHRSALRDVPGVEIHGEWIRFTTRARPDRAEGSESVQVPTVVTPPPPQGGGPQADEPAVTPQDEARPVAAAAATEPPPTPAHAEPAQTAPPAAPTLQVRPPPLLPAQSKTLVLGAGPPQGPPQSKFPAVAAALEAVGEVLQARAEEEAARAARIAPAPRPVPPVPAPAPAKKPSAAMVERARLAALMAAKPWHVAADRPAAPPPPPGAVPCPPPTQAPTPVGPLQPAPGTPAPPSGAGDTAPPTIRPPPVHEWCSGPQPGPTP